MSTCDPMQFKDSSLISLSLGLQKYFISSSHYFLVDSDVPSKDHDSLSICVVLLSLCHVSPGIMVSGVNDHGAFSWGGIRVTPLLMTLATGQGRAWEAIINLTISMAVLYSYGTHGHLPSWEKEYSHWHGPPWLSISWKSFFSGFNLTLFICRIGSALRSSRV